MQLPKTLSDALLLLHAQEKELVELRAQQQDWINLVRDFMGENRVKTLKFKEDA